MTLRLLKNLNRKYSKQILGFLGTGGNNDITGDAIVFDCLLAQTGKWSLFPQLRMTVEDALQLSMKGFDKLA